MIAGVDYIHYQDFHGRVLNSTLQFLAPYVFCLVLPRKWLATALPIPISAALVMSLPILVSFAWGFHTDPQQDLKLMLVLITIIGVFIASITTAMLHRRAIKACLFVTSLAASLIYYIAVLQYAR